MLVQFDGSEHMWFGGFVSDLIAGIDDATGKLLSAEFFTWRDFPALNEGQLRILLKTMVLPRHFIWTKRPSLVSAIEIGIVKL